jgi:hypothetical protein
MSYASANAYSTGIALEPALSMLLSVSPISLLEVLECLDVLKSDLRRRKVVILIMLVVGALLGLNSGRAASVSKTVPSTPGPLRVLASNPRYFTDGTGKAVYLTGSHTWSNLLDRGTIATPPAFDFSAYMNFMASHGFNFMRLWTVGMTYVGNADPNIAIVAGPLPWTRTGPGTANDGKPKFDLTQFDRSYFDRLRARTILAGQNGIYVAVQLFDGYNPEFSDGTADGNPFRGTNNINGIDCAGTCTQTAPVSPAVWSFEQAYLHKLVDSLNDLDNVMYEVANEAGDAYSTQWQYNVINSVKQYEATKPKQHPIGMTCQYLSGSNDANLYSSPADWISTCTRFPVINVSKVNINDTDHSYYWRSMKWDGTTAQRQWVWKNFMTGNSTAFMDPYLVVWRGRNSPGGATADPGIGMTLDPRWDAIRNAMRDTAAYARKINLAAMTPQSSLCSTGYCLVNSGSEYLVYQPGTGAFTVNLLAGKYGYEWFNPTSGVIVSTGSITVASGNQSFTEPFNSDAVLYLKIGTSDKTPVPPGLSTSVPETP